MPDSDLVRMTSRLTESDVRILDRIKKAGFYTSRNTAMVALIRGCGTQLADRLEASFDEVRYDTAPTPGGHQVDTSAVTSDTNLTPGDDDKSHQVDTSAVTSDTNLTPDWQALIGEA